MSRSEAMRRLWADPEFLAAMRARGRRRGGVVCPRWVPRALVEEFFDAAVLYGEEAAASRALRLKRQMEVP